MSLTGDDNQALIWMFGVVAIFQIIFRVESFLTEVAVETKGSIGFVPYDTMTTRPSLPLTTSPFSKTDQSVEVERKPQ